MLLNVTLLCYLLSSISNEKENSMGKNKINICYLLSSISNGNGKSHREESKNV